MRGVGIRTAVPFPRIARRIHAARREGLVVEDVVEVAQPEAVVRAVGIHVVNVGHVQAKAQIVVGRRLLMVVEGGLGGLNTDFNLIRCSLKQCWDPDSDPHRSVPVPVPLCQILIRIRLADIFRLKYR